MKKLNERQIEVLGDIQAASASLMRQCEKYGGRECEVGGWVRPMDFGGTDASHHSATATRLAKKGLVEVYEASVKFPWRSRLGGGKRYRLTDAGRAILRKGRL